MSRNVKDWFPLFEALKGYDKTRFRSDLLAGLTTAVMLVPQAMGYAMLAGLPPIVGLYASLVPLGLYALFGSSRQLAVGPVAMVSLLVAAGVGAAHSQLGLEPTPTTFVAYAVLLSVMVGAIQFVMGVGRLGFVVRFLSHPVISGFTSAAALIIGFSQLKHLLGVNIPRSHHVHTILLSAVERVGEVQPITLAIGVVAIAALVLLKRFAPAFPRALLVVAGSALAVWGLGLHERGVAIVGDVPAGLPPLSVPTFDWAAIQALWPTALVISFVGFMESISVAKAFARKEGYEVDANQELVGLGLANLGGSLFGAYPVTGGFSRTAVNAQAGAKSGVASLITAGVVGLTLLFLTPAFHYLPKVVLAAIIMTAVFGLIDVAEVRHLWKVDRVDLALLGVTFATTLALGIEQGILAGVGASLFAFIWNSTQPHIARIGQHADGSWRDVARYPEGRVEPGELVVRIDASLYFANVAHLKGYLERFERDLEEPLESVVIDARGINRVDSSALSALADLHRVYDERGVELTLVDAKASVRDAIDRAGLTDALGISAPRPVPPTGEGGSQPPKLELLRSA